MFSVDRVISHLLPLSVKIALENRGGENNPILYQKQE